MIDTLDESVSQQTLQRRFLLVGDVILDFISMRTQGESHRSYVQFGGGAIANVARHLASMDHHTQLITAFAPDPFGTSLRGQLRTHGVGLEYAVTLPDQESPLCFVSNSEDGERYFLHRGGDPFGAMTSPSPMPNKAYDWLVWGISSMRTVEHRFTIDSLIKNHTGLVVCDPGTCPSWWGEPHILKTHLMERLANIDILKCSQPEAQWLSGIAHPAEAAHWLAERGPSLAIVTAGAEGIFAQCGTESSRLTVEKVDALDTTGAGDATLAGLLGALDPRQNCFDPIHLKHALRAGAQMGTKTVLFQGAGPWIIG